MLGNNPLRDFDSLLCLGIPLENICFTEVSKEQSKRNIADNICAVLEVTGSEGNSFRGNGSTGFMITTDGFIVTTYHSVKDWLLKWDIVKDDIPGGFGGLRNWVDRWKTKYCVGMPNGKVYALDPTFYRYSENHDIALIKAITFEKKPLPIRFRIVEAMHRDQELEFLGFVSGQRYNQFGKVLETGQLFQNGADMKFNTFLTDAYAEEGFSGGVFVDVANGAFLGIATYRDRNPSGGRSIIGGACARDIKEFVRIEQAREAYRLLKE